MNYKLNSIRVDYRPSISSSDLDLAHARRLFNITNSVIKREFYTVKFTSNLYLQIWFKKKINTAAISGHLREIFDIYQSLNHIKKTKVSLVSTGIINLQASGRLKKKVDFELINKEHLPQGYRLLATSSLLEPFLPTRDVQKGTTYLQITRNFSSLLRICYSGNFTIIARNILEYKELLAIAKTI